MRFRPLLLLAVLALASCEPARRYPAAPNAPVAPTDKPAADLPVHWSWMRAIDTPPDIPIEFVPASSPHWAALPQFWNDFPPPAAGMRTIHFGLPPLAAVTGLVATDRMQTVRIKVPLGLPDPSPHIPAANPPTYAKWRLGKQVFFAPLLRSGSETYACATCHQPGHGFTEAWRVHPGGTVRTPSLLNAVYNQRQFWDGRVRALEEVVVRALQDEEPTGRAAPEIAHRWGGLVRALAADDAYRIAFERVFGIRQPTQDAIAKALATYVRTILAGDSVYDRADAARRRAKAAGLTEEHFRPLLDAGTLKGLGDGSLSADAAAQRLAEGYRIFSGKARCAACHPPALFTDGDFHNIGLAAADDLPSPDKAPGRFATVPIGLKEQRLVGAYKTPTLRGRMRTSPYFHDGKRRTLREVIAFYDHEIVPSPYLAAALGTDRREPLLGLSADEIESLALFLESLNGAQVAPMVRLP